MARFDCQNVMPMEATKTTRTTAELRRDQLLEIARKIIETEGVEALRPTRVAELAGCTRPLIYQYFPRREDIFIAITEELYVALDMGVEEGEQLGVIPAAAKGDGDPARVIIRRLWEHIDAKGPAALILRSTPQISADFRGYLARIRESYELRWLKGFLDLGLDAAQADLMLEMFVTVMKVLALQHLNGEIDRNTAIERHIQTIGGMLDSAVAANAS